MFVLQTTIAILIAFLALTAYNKFQSRISKGKSRRKDLEAPASPKIISKLQTDSDGDQDTWKEPTLSEMSPDSCKEMQHYKLLYYKLHNLESHPDILPECHDLLVSFLTTTLSDASKDKSQGILSIPEFSREQLNDFLTSKDTECTNNYEAYITRRRAGGAREIFSTQSEAKWWLKQAAPVKYVDGAWLGHINKVSTPFRHSRVTKNAWQVMSEELGDGELMKEIDAGLPEADSEDFIHARHGLIEARCWKAAVAQLLISLFPHEFLPEALGFNMAYESLPLHLLKTVKELREVKLNPYYFELHVSIDNGHTGHAAMAMETVVSYIESVAKEGGEEVAHLAWKRVQAGFILAEGLPTTPESPSLKQESSKGPFPRNETEARLLEVFSAKTPVAHKIHCNSRLKIGRRSLVDWLEPNSFKGSQWQQEFMDDLSNCRPWVIKGNSEKSRLVQEMSWGGKMFGSFMQSEVETLKEWIDTLGAPTREIPVSPKVYYDFTGKSPVLPEGNFILRDYPSFTQSPSEIIKTWSSIIDIPASDFQRPDYILNNTNELNLPRFLPLWFASRALLESLPSVPVRAADPFGSAIVRILRAQTGFSEEGPGVAGMDEVQRTCDGEAVGIVELGLEMCSRAGLHVPQSLQEVIDTGHCDSNLFALCMVSISMHWLAYRNLLVGMAWAVMEMHFWIAESDDGRLLSDSGKNTLRSIALRERGGLEVCIEEMERDEERKKQFVTGKSVMQEAIAKCFPAREKAHE